MITDLIKHVLNNFDCKWKKIVLYLFLWEKSVMLNDRQSNISWMKIFVLSTMKVLKKKNCRAQKIIKILQCTQTRVAERERIKRIKPDLEKMKEPREKEWHRYQR